MRVFEPDYYDEFDPRSALQMVFRTPGFNPQERDGGRGLSGVRSNILIDGERPQRPIAPATAARNARPRR